jgi:Ca-activated chloride channel family protein
MNIMRNSACGMRNMDVINKKTLSRIPNSALRMVFAVSLLAAPVFASETQLKEGNRLFRKGHYEEALKKYNDALIDSPESSVLRFNAGDAAYQAGDFASAQKQFHEAGDRSPVPALRSACRYNEGNALYRQNQWKDAIEAYKEALRVNPADDDARYNLGVALNALKNPPKQKPQSGQGKQNQQKENQKNKSNGMSKEEAERLMAAAGSNEKKKPNAQAAKPGAPKSDEDW